MSIVKKIFNKINDVGVKDSLKTIYYNRMLRPYIKQHVIKKYKVENAELSNKEFNASLRNEYKSSSDDSFQKLLKHFSSRTSPKFYPAMDAALTDEFRELYSEEISETIAKADCVLENDLSWITPRCPKFEKEINWHSAFKNDQSWQLDFFAELDYSSEKRPGDVREVWEINRHQFFITLGKAYRLTGEKKYADKFAELLNDWIDKNPCGYGINWLHSQETGIRMISWIWAYYFFKDSECFNDSLKIKFFKSLYQHAEYTYWTLSRGLTTHNHLVSEICGLLIFSLMFPEFKNSSKWKSSCTKIYNREILKQIWESGPSAELSTNYHLFVLDSFLQTYVLLKVNGHVHSEEVNNRLEKMIEYASYIIKPDGAIPKIGDNDSGRSFKLSEKDENERRYYLAAGSVLFNRKDFKGLTQKFYEEAFWLLGNDGLQKFNSSDQKENLQLSNYFDPSGFAVFRDGTDLNANHIVFRGGPTKRRKNVSTSHNHADLLSFELFSNKNSFLIDPGNFLYSFDDRWRFYYRKTFCHNTVTVDDKDSVNVTASRFGIPKLPLSKLHNIKHKKDYDFIDMSHSGYEGIGIEHRRKMFFAKEKYLLIVDLITGDGTHKVVQNFNIDTRKVEIDIKKQEISLSFNDKLNDLQILPVCKNMADINVSKAAESPIDAWASDKYGEKHEASILRLNYLEKLPFVCGVLINLNFSTKIDIISQELNETEQHIVINYSDKQETVSFRESSLEYIR